MIKLFLFLLFFSTQLLAQNENALDLNPLQAEAFFSPMTFGAGQSINLEIKMKLETGHIAYYEKFNLQALHPSFAISQLEIAPLIEFTDPVTKKTKNGIQDFATLKTLVELPLHFPPGQHLADFELTYQACTKTYCLFPKKILLQIPFTSLAEPSETSSQIKPPQNFLNLSQLSHQNIGLWTFLIIFAAGILTSFTPCIFPMIPITLAVIGARSQGVKKVKSFLLSLIYVLGIALTYSLLGLIAASTGALFGSFLGNFWVLGFIALIFILMGFSMLGLFELKVPIAFEKPFLKIPRSGFMGAFLSGLFAGLIASPCVGPVLVSILTFVAQTQNQILGFSLLFVFSMGMGLIFIVLGTASHLINYLPKSGPWLKGVKIFFAFTMFGIAIYVLQPVFNQIDLHKSNLTWKTYDFQSLNTLTTVNQPTIIDLYADWCTACKELDKYTFSDPQVEKIMNTMNLIRLNASHTSKELQGLQSLYPIRGLPTLLFFSKSGQYLENFTLNEFEKADAFLKRLQKVEQSP